MQQRTTPNAYASIPAAHKRPHTSSHAIQHTLKRIRTQERTNKHAQARTCTRVQTYKSAGWRRVPLSPPCMRTPAYARSSPCALRCMLAHACVGACACMHVYIRVDRESCTYARYSTITYTLDLKTICKTYAPDTRPLVDTSMYPYTYTHTTSHT
jgi:hypothetical protein